MLGCFLCISFSVNALEKEVSMAKERKEVEKKDCWDVEALFASRSAWQKELQDFVEAPSKVLWPSLAAYRGALTDPKKAKDFLNLCFAKERVLEKLYTYAHLRFDEDLSNDQTKEDFQKITTLLHAFREETSWVAPEILSMPEKAFQSLLQDKGLSLYHFHLEKVGRMRPHTLPFAMEELLAKTGKALGTSHKAFGALANVDLSFADAIDSSGKKHPLSNGTYLSLLQSGDRSLRKTAYLHLHQAYLQHKNTLCELLQGQVEAHFLQARARNFPSCLEAALFPHAVPKTVYENLIQAVRAHLPTMHRYIALRKKHMKLQDIHVYDLYVPLVADVDRTMSYDEACRVVSNSVALLGKEYQETLTKGLTSLRWVDVLETSGKRSGAYSSGCYDSMPYILLNYHGTFSDVTTLAHEAGHSMHSYLSRSHQPYPYADYSIFVAEVASTFNEQLLLAEMRKHATTKKEEIYLLNDELERLRGTLFRQTLFAEFEQKIHAFVEKGIPLTPTLLSTEYRKLQEEYYGPELTLDPEGDVEWARIPHFYYNFYVYQYATGISAALALYEGAKESSEARKKYLQFLSSGGSDYPIEILRKAGVDMETKAPVEKALRRFAAIVEKLEELL